jgi:HEAT repeat protein
MSLFALAIWLLAISCTATSQVDGPNAVASHLVSLLNDPEPDVRRTAALSLGKIAVPESAPALTQALGDPDSLVRQYSAWALGNLGEHAPEASVLALVPLLGDSSLGVSAAAAEAVGKIGASQRALDLLTHALRDHSAGARRAAMQALAWLEEPSTYPYIQQALNDPDADVRQGAIAALGELGERRAVSAMLDRLLHDPDTGVRAEAAYRLGKLGDVTTVSTLQQAARNDREDTVKRWARWAIDQMVPTGEPGSAT